MVVLSGARQCGKTTLVKVLFKNYDYFNYDLEEDREMLKNKQWRRDKECVIFDELHKMPEWKRWLKGIYDTEGLKTKIIITGSVNVESFMKVGDSLAGRYFHLRLHPIDLKEGVAFWHKNPTIVFNKILDYSGFPEPFIKGSGQFYRRWQRTHMDVIPFPVFISTLSCFVFCGAHEYFISYVNEYNKHAEAYIHNSLLAESVNCNFIPPFSSKRGVELTQESDNKAIRDIVAFPKDSSKKESFLIAIDLHTNSWNNIGENANFDSYNKAEL